MYDKLSREMLNGSLPPYTLFTNMEPIEDEQWSGNTEISAESGGKDCPTRTLSLYKHPNASWTDINVVEAARLLKILSVVYELLFIEKR